MNPGKETGTTICEENGILNFQEAIEKMVAILKEKGLDESKIDELIKRIYG